MASALGLTATARAASRTAGTAEEPGRRRTGLFGLGFGPDMNLGGTTAVKELGGALGGLVQLGTAWMPGGAPAGQVYSAAGKGLASSLMGTASSLMPGTQFAFKPLSRTLLGEEYEAKPIWERAGERGILPALIEDVGNLALGAGTALKVAQVGSVAGKAAAASRAVSAAQKAGLGMADITRAQAAGQTASAAGRFGRAGRIAEQGIGRTGRFTGRPIVDRQLGTLGHVARTEARAAPVRAAAATDDVARSARRQAVLEKAAHPYKTAFSGAVRPLTRAAQANVVARSAATAEDFARPGDEAAEAGALAEAYGTMPTEAPAARVARSDLEAQRQAYGTQGPIGRATAVAEPEGTVGRAASADLGGPDVIEGTPPRIGPRELAERALGPTPEWAQRAVGRFAKAEGRTEKVLAGAEARIQGHMMNRVMRERSRFAEADRRAVMTSGAMTTARAASQWLVDKVDDAGERITSERAEGMVFDHISRQLDQTAMLEEVVRRGGDENHPLYQLIKEKTGAQFPIPKRYLADEELMGHLSGSVDEWRELARQREQTLLSGRLGERGLEDIGTDEHQLTPAQAKEFRRLQHESRRLSRKQQLAEKEAEAKRAEIMRVDDEMGALAEESRRLSEEAAGVRGEINDLARPVGLQDASRATSWQKIIGQVSERGGALFDVHAGELITAAKYLPQDKQALGATGFVVGVKGKTLGIQEWQANPQQVLEDFAAEMDPALQHRDAKIRVSVQGDQVTLDVAQTTIGGKPMSRLQASILASARGEATVGNFNGPDLAVATDPASSAVAAHHVAALLKPSSEFNRFLRQWDRTFDQLRQWEAEKPPNRRQRRKGKFLKDSDLDDMAQVHMRFALGTKNAGRFSDVDDYYKMIDVEAKATAARSPADALFQVYLQPSFDPAKTLTTQLWKQAVKFLGPDADRALRWYNEGHETVVRRWGDQSIELWDQRTQAPKTVRMSDLVFSLLAVTSVNASPLTNMQASMATVARLVDYQQMSDWTQKFNAGMASWYKRLETDPIVRKASPAVKAEHIYTELAKYVPHLDKVRENVMEILSGRLLDEWDTDYIEQRFGREAVSREALGARLDPAVAKERTAAKGALSRANKTGDADKIAAAQARLDTVEARARELMAEVPESARMEMAGSDAYAKIRSFWENLRDPENSQGVTLDRIMGDLLGLKGGQWGKAGVYREAAEAVRNLADQASISMYGEPGRIKPHMVQAMLWVYTKRLTNEHDLGRLLAAGLDALDQIQTGDASAWRAGQSAVHDYLQSDIAFFERTQEIEPREVGVVTPPKGRTLADLSKLTPEDLAALRRSRKAAPDRTEIQYSFFQEDEIKKIKEQLGVKREDVTKEQLKVGATTGKAVTFGALAEDIAAHLDNGDIPAAQDRLLGWLRDQASRYNAEAEYFEDFFTKAHDPESKSAAVLNQLDRQGLLGDGDGTSPLFQKFEDDLALGATFRNTNTGRLTMQFFKTADPTTLMHESAHLLRLMLPEADVKFLLERYQGKKVTPAGQLQKRAQALVGRIGKVGFEEAFADDMVRYMTTGRAPAGLEQVFGRIKETLRLWWGGMMGRFVDTIDPGVAELIDRYLDPDAGEVPDLPEMKLDLSGKTAQQLAAQLPVRPGETQAQALRRGHRAGRKAAQLDQLEHRQAQATRRRERMESTKQQLLEQLEAGGPAAAAYRKALIANDKALEKLLGIADRPALDRVPGQWVPLWGALEELWKEAEGNEAMARALEGLPKTFPELTAYAREHGWDPTHVASLGDEKVRRLAFEPLRLKVKETEAGTRKSRTRAFAETRNLAALAAAQVDVILERETNELVTYIEQVVARPLAEGQVIPPGWRGWRPEDTWIKTSPAGEGRRAAGAHRPTYMVPEHVHQMLQGYSRNYDHAILQGLRRVTSPWRTWVLTLTPRWYMNNVIGNMVMATKAGVRLDDWAKAWAAYRREWKDEIPGLAEAGELGQVVGPELFTEAWAGQQRTSLTGRPAPEGRLGAKSPRAVYRQERAGGAGRFGAAKQTQQRMQEQLVKMNSVVDDIARSAVYLSQKRKGFSPDQALQMSYEALVDYGDLSPFERAMVRSVVPFYAFQKGVLKQVARFPIDHPQASAVAMQLGLLNQEIQEGLPEMYASMVDLPVVGHVNLRSANPFMDGEALISPQGIARSMNPFLAVFARNALGAPQTGYPEHQRIDEFGRVVPTTSPDEELQAIVTGLPQIQLAGGLAGAEEVGGRPVQGGAAGAGLRFLGIPQVSEERVEELRTRLAESKVKLSKFEAGRARRAQRKEQPALYGQK